VQHLLKFHRLFVIDSFVVIYQIENALKNAQIGDRQIAIDYKQASLDWVQNLGFLPLLSQTPNKTVVWVQDSKPYWRDFYAPDYKAGRKEKTPSFFETVSMIEKAKLPVLKVPSFEADDLAAMYVQMFMRSTGNIGQLWLLTVDSDWQGLLGADGVIWYDTNGYTPRMRTTRESYAWLTSKWNRQSAKTKKLWPLPAFHKYVPQDIWEWKAIAGDKSDNLGPGTPKELISLFEPPQEYRLIDNSKVVEEATKLLSHQYIPVMSTTECHKVFRKTGIGPPISIDNPPLKTVDQFCPSRFRC
jgi:5'-3' exonuclease